MDIDLIFKIAAIGIIVAVLNQLLIRSGREDQAMMTTLAGLVVVLYTLFQKSAPAFGLFVSMGAAVLVLWKISTAAQTVLSGLTKLEQRAGGDAFSCLLRCTGVILLADYAHSLCEEAGAESLAWCTALAGRVLVLAAAWPLLEEIGQKIGSIAG